MKVGRPLQFQIEDSEKHAEVSVALGNHFRLASENEMQVKRTFFDTFDWRLFQAGETLQQEKTSLGQFLIWRSLGGGMPRESVRCNDGVPRFSWDYPAGLLRDMLHREVEMRALLPVVEVSCRIRPLRIVNRDDKTVVRLELEEVSARATGRSAAFPLASRITIKPIRGYPKSQQRVIAFLKDKLKLHEVEESYLVPALKAIGRAPLDYSSKLSFQFKPGERAADVAKRIHLQLLDTLETNLPGTRANTDSEFLHDLRVSVRRTRSALGQIKGVFPDEIIEEYKERFAWMGQITGPTRDMDVYLLGFEGYQQTLPESFRADLEPLRAFLVEHQKIEQQAMVRKLNSPHCRKILKDWRAFLESPNKKADLTDKGAKPIGKLASKRIYRLYQRVYDEGSAIHSLSPAEDLHELRKSCKKLRYMIEFFQSLYPAKEIKPLIKTLKQLLNNLGDFQDLEVQADKLRDFAHSMSQEGVVPADTLLAMGMLVDGLLKRQEMARREFSDCFKLFSNQTNCCRYENLFGGATKGGEGQ